MQDKGGHPQRSYKSKYWAPTYLRGRPLDAQCYITWRPALVAAETAIPRQLAFLPRALLVGCFRAMLSGLGLLGGWVRW